MYMHVCMCVCLLMLRTLVSVISTGFCCFFSGFSVYLNLRSRKRRGTYFNCSPFGHEVQQLSAKLAIVIVLFSFSVCLLLPLLSSSVNAPCTSEFNRKCYH